MSLSAVFITFFLALGVSMDAFAVSISNGLCYGQREDTGKIALYSGLTFGLFQGLMPLLGFLAGSLFRELAEGVDHWIALLLLGAVGGKMIYDAIVEMRNPAGCPCPVFTKRLLFLQGIATSIDAFAVGIGLAMDDKNIFIIAPATALTTFAFSFVGVFIGRRFGKVIGDKAQLFGGVILVGIGLQIFISHTFNL